MEEKEKVVFEKLNAINVNEHTEKKNDLTYLSWAWAWAAVKKEYPNATYRVIKNFENLPYFYDEGIGAMVYTEVTIGDLTHEMWLPVMDSNNKAMKKEPYTIKTKFGYEIKVEPFTMFDVNKAVMRCLTKNLAMFGLGLYIYAGEDLPEDAEQEKKPEEQQKEQVKPNKQEEKKQEPVQPKKAPVKKYMATSAQIAMIENLYTPQEVGMMLMRMKRSSLKEITMAEAQRMVEARNGGQNGN